MTEPQNAQAKRPKGRSPSYPAINLENAIRRAAQFFDLARQHPTAVEHLVQHWGYKSLNGPASLTVAALKKFGLLTDEGSGDERRARLTDLAVDILANPAPDAVQTAIRTAALNPAIHRELWERYGADLPPDVNLRWELIRERGFTETGASEFIPQYRATVAFARLAEFADLGSDGPRDLGDDGDDDEDEDNAQTRRLDTPKRRDTRPDNTVRTYAVPLMSGKSVVVEGPFPITEPDWTQFLAVLTAMKPGLVAPTEVS